MCCKLCIIWSPNLRVTCQFQVEMGRNITQTYKSKKVEIQLRRQPPCIGSFCYLAIKGRKNITAGLSKEGISSPFLSQLAHLPLYANQ